jgi:hypothetical protein
MLFNRRGHDTIDVAHGQEQGNKIEVYDLGQQGMVFVENKLVMLTGTIVVHKSMKALPIKTGGADTELAVNNETLHCHEVTGKQKEQVLDTVDKRPDQRLRVDVRPRVVEHKREGNTEAHKVIGGKEQRDHVTGGDSNSPMVSEEEGMPTCVTNAKEHGDMAVAREHGDVAVASIPNTCIQTVTRDDSKAYLSSETEGCNKERLMAVRSEAMRPCYGQQVTQQLQSREMEWRLSCSHWREVIIGIGRGVNDDSLGICGGPKKSKHNNRGVIDGTGANKWPLQVGPGDCRLDKFGT